MTVYLNLKSEIGSDFYDTGWSSGFSNFTFHPAFADNGLLYTSHSERPGSAPADYSGPDFTSVSYQSVVTEWKCTDPGASVFTGTRRELLRVDQPRSNHPVSQLRFNPTAIPGDKDYGMLYIGSGDGGSLYANTPSNLQRLDSPLGTIMRIDP